MNPDPDVEVLKRLVVLVRAVQEMVQGSTEQLNGDVLVPAYLWDAVLTAGVRLTESVDSGNGGGNADT